MSATYRDRALAVQVCERGCPKGVGCAECQYREIDRCSDAHNADLIAAYRLELTAPLEARIAELEGALEGAAGQLVDIDICSCTPNVLCAHCKLHHHLQEALAGGAGE